MFNILENKTVAFLGAGSMAESMIAGTIKANKIPAECIYVTNKFNGDRLTELQERYQVKTVLQKDLPFEEIDYFIMAMKPHGAEEALAFLKDKIKREQVVISVLAGISTDYMEAGLNEYQPVIRVMPNTSSMIQESATALAVGNFTEDVHLQDVKEILSCMGKVFVINEEQMDIFTGLAGSGPAYFYYLMEQMEKVGIEKGLDADAARKIVAQTIYGAAKMVLDKEEAPMILRERVTSPNGTTASGVQALQENNGGRAISQAVQQAAARSKEIRRELEGTLVPH
ncbi:pyrroline-5-carboxylate reductase [Cytobacillus purgationiresistens]|uniref:Pyrroline-5-carboxylate reductase n=1 Tax=Cytobacillus purgationiresistens TaxID=863449 RepID=A0ABU0AMY6_9BACI|nr:pyrroline-5-carboxylate reductase [Cytobacillus purgationiresistens]